MDDDEREPIAGGRGVRRSDVTSTSSRLGQARAVPVTVRPAIDPGSWFSPMVCLRSRLIDLDGLLC